MYVGMFGSANTWVRLILNDPKGENEKLTTQMQRITRTSPNEYMSRLIQDILDIGDS